MPLADLRLVRGVRGEELATLGDGAYGGGHDTIVRSRPDEDRQAGDVLSCRLVYVGERLVLGERRLEIQLPLELRRDVGEEVVQRVDPDGLQHLLYVGLGMRCESRHAVLPLLSGGRFWFSVLSPKPESITPSAPVPVPGPDSPGRPPARGPFA